jgi:hypothetical protein
MSPANWTYYNEKGLRQEVKDRVAANQLIPPEAKALLQQEIDALPENCRGVRIDAYAQTELHPQGTGNITRRIGITLVGIAL